MEGKSFFAHFYILAKRYCLAFFLVLISLAPFLEAGRCFAAGTELVRVAVINYPNYIQKNPNGTISGYAYEYLKTLQKYTGWKYEFIEMSFAEASKALEKGEIDLLAGNQRTPEREAMYNFSSRSMGEGGSVLCIMPNDMRYSYNEFTAYSGMKIAALASSVRIEQTRKKLEQYGVIAQFIPFETDEASKAALERGEVDAVLMSEIRCENKYKILARLSSVPLYFCINKKRPTLKVQLDEAMEELHLESPYYEAHLSEAYYGSIPVQRSFTQAEKAYIAAASPIVVAIADDLVPIEYYSEEKGGYFGAVPDVFKLIEAYSGLVFHFVTRQDMADLRKQMDAGTVQLLASVAGTEALGALWNVNLSVPYYDNSVSLVINDSVRDYKNADCRLVLRTGYPYLEQFARELGYTNVQFADSFNDCVAMVNAKNAELTLIPSNCVDSIIHWHSYSNVSSYLLPNSYMRFCMGIARSADPRLLSILNKSISSIPQEKKMELLTRNLTMVNDSVNLSSLFAAHRLSILAVVLTLALFILAGAVSFAISRQRLSRWLKLALEKADIASRAKTEFFTRISHDMRTPMNGILGLTYLMEDSATGAKQKNALLQLRKSGEYLLQLINDLLDINKAEMGKINLHPTVCDEMLLFESIITIMKPQMEKKKIDFYFERKHTQKAYLLLDEQRVKQIFINLLSNAVKFTPKGGRIEFIMAPVLEDKQKIRNKFIIRDTGIGMAEEFLPYLFEPFLQEKRTSKETEGTGLGLVIVKSLVDLMHGSISVQSKVNEGTEFTIFLDFPLAQDQGDAEAQPPSPSLDFPAGICVLLCEDQPLNAQIAIHLLEKWGAEVVWKADGRLGVEAFTQSKQGLFDVILMDICMPVMGGLDAANAIRTLPRPDAKTVPIIAMTANAYAEDIQKSLAAGMNEHLTKPINPSVMYEIITKQLAANTAHGKE